MGACPANKAVPLPRVLDECKSRSTASGAALKGLRSGRKACMTSVARHRARAPTESGERGSFSLQIASHFYRCLVGACQALRFWGRGSRDELKADTDVKICLWTGNSEGQSGTLFRAIDKGYYKRKDQHGHGDTGSSRFWSTGLHVVAAGHR